MRRLSVGMAGSLLGLAALLGTTGADESRAAPPESTPEGVGSAGRADGASHQQPEVANRGPDDPALQYNIGTRAYRRREYANSAEALNRALASGGKALQGRSAYNLGDAYYRLGQAKERTAPEEAGRLYQQALAQYRFAIREDPGDRDAQFNYELVERHLKQLPQPTSPRQQSSQAQAAQSQKAQQGQTAPTQQQQESQKMGQEAHKDTSGSSTDASSGQSAHEKEQPDAKEQAARAAQRSRDQADKEKGTAAQAMASDASRDVGSSADQSKALSKQQALWILDAARQEERGTVARQPQESARESAVEEDW